MSTDFPDIVVPVASFSSSSNLVTVIVTVTAVADHFSDIIVAVLCLDDSGSFLVIIVAAVGADTSDIVVTVIGSKLIGTIVTSPSRPWAPTFST